MQDIAVQFEKHCWIHSVSLFPPQVHVGRSPFTNSGSFKTKDNRSVEENELIKLRKELKQLRMENDILKQAALIIGRK
ncbi:hypothetical protein [Spiroplasma endosymbiont of Apeira syringaria]|uniref:hypothetical protein n=1 Tax=Spiroplasma endosymbiont of Apeira syringaria TaxID=3066307 RepID=UPI0030D4186C